MSSFSLPFFGPPPTTSAISKSKEYQSFKSNVAKKTFPIEHGKEMKIWSYYDYGPREVRCPIIFLPPCSGTADIFFKQQLALGTSGMRCIAVDAPPFWTHEEWCEGFLQFLDHLRLDQVHIFGASVGGFLGQKFAVHTAKSQRVQSLILCNSFMDTTVFSGMPHSSAYRFLPSFILKRYLLEAFPKGRLESEIANSVDFMVERIDILSRSELASRLTLNMYSGYIEPQHIARQDIKMMVMSVMDKHAITSPVQSELSKCYPDAKEAQLKNGGNFPYLARDAEVTMYIRVHLRQFAETRYSAGDDFDWGKSRAEGAAAAADGGDTAGSQ